VLSPTALKAAKCTTASMRPAREAAGAAQRRVADVGALEHRHGPAGVQPASTSGELLEKSSTPTTSKPASCSASQVCEPM
jgi:hypothetical protein